MLPFQYEECVELKHKLDEEDGVASGEEPEV